MFSFPKSAYNAILFRFFIMPLFFVSFSVADMNWTGEHCAFTVETFIKTNESVTATQRAFCLHFDLGRHDPVPARNTIPPDSQESDGGAIRRVSNYPDLLPEMTRYCCPLVI